MAGWKSVCHTGSGSMDVYTGRMAAMINRPIAIPKTTPSSAICAPTSSGRTASRVRDHPMAMPMPISRRCASTMRLARLKAPKVAPARMRPAKMFQKRWSPSMSS